MNQCAEALTKNHESMHATAQTVALASHKDIRIYCRVWWPMGLLANLQTCKPASPLRRSTILQYTECIAILHIEPVFMHDASMDTDC